MAKSKLVKVNEKIAEGVTTGFKKMSDGVTTGFKKMSDGVVEGYTKIEDKFVDQFLTKDGETVEETSTFAKNSNHTLYETLFIRLACRSTHGGSCRSPARYNFRYDTNQRRDHESPPLR